MRVSCCASARAAGDARVVTIAPVVEHSGVHFAALGLPAMLNGGGAVSACSLAPAAAWSQGLLDRHALLCSSLIGLPDSCSVMRSAAPFEACILMR